VVKNAKKDRLLERAKCVTRRRRKKKTRKERLKKKQRKKRENIFKISKGECCWILIIIN